MAACFLAKEKVRVRFPPSALGVDVPAVQAISTWFATTGLMLMVSGAIFSTGYMVITGGVFIVIGICGIERSRS